MSNISNAGVEQAQFIAVARGGAEHDEGDGASIAMAKACMLDELIGAVFGAISLWYLVSSLAALV